MLQFLPLDYSRDMLVNLLWKQGFAGHVDFIFVPHNLSTGSSLGYAFVNFTTQKKAEECRRIFEGFSSWETPSDAVCVTRWCKTHGLEANIERNRNCPMMHPIVPDAFRPAIFSHLGERLPFPAPTKAVKQPRINPHFEQLGALAGRRHRGGR